ncbi:(2,3-dihydroxybenzoyl)adenylate synthase [Planomonospora parontospora]|uniref:(2,3-dihydroxybenzoyl)adenylate synthase n=1 Tax=Planomonospora parontospora TaxID=58119 RepID=UPI0016703EBA|nr:AMP-binding protein [Planomonospora parontospora]GGL51447.1 2,3-dihydroxybenzoate-AMP ligase [Planomonospora parontospora subsp. antibiotica]GII19107.1 2,3-dihydroxybenzoate-AMP ligase [Planomonospora parontospora subsp. antibiotica]
MIPGCVPWPAETARRYRELGLWSGQTLDTLLHAHGERTALVSGGVRRSYRELAVRAARLAAGFHDLGVRRGDRVIVQLPNTPDLIDTLFALFTLGAAPVLALPPHRRDEIGHLAAQTEAVAYVIPAVHQGFDHRELARRISGPEHVVVAGEPEEFTPLASLYAEPAELERPEPGDVALFLLSGGTTGRSKLIPRTHDDYLCNIRLSAANARFGPDDVYLAALPIAHNYALGCPGVLGTLHAGGRVVLSPTPSPDDTFPLIESERVTVTGLVPSLALLWVEAASWSPHDLSSLRLVQVGGAGVSPQLARDVGERLGRVQQSFGMAEGLLSQSPPDDPPELLATAQGRPLSEHDEVRIVDEKGDELPPGEVGELLVRGPYTIRGYFRAEEHNARAFTAEGFFRTGDLARRTGTGHLVVCGRIKDVINRGGDKVPAEEVEEHLLAHSRVLAAAVVPVPDPYLGERTCAYIVARGEPPTPGEIDAFMRERGVAAYKIPDRVAVVPSLPLTPVGKVDKARLRSEAP